MANSDAPNGFTPAKHLSGGTIRASEYAIADQAAIDLFSGDLCLLTDSGVLAEYVDATSTAVLGVFMGCEYTAADGTVVFSPKWVTGTATKGAAGAKAYVYDDPNIIYRAQCSGTAAATHVGEGVSAEGAGTGNAVTGRSIMEVNEDGAANPVVQILGLVDSADNAWGLNAEVYVRVLNNQFAASV